MDISITQIVSDILGAVTKIIVAIIAGYFAVKAAEVTVSKKNLPSKTHQRKTSTPKTDKVTHLPSQIKFTKPVFSRRKIVLYGLMTGIIAMPLGFLIAYIGNWLYCSSSPYLFGDSIDPALVSGFLSLLGFIFGFKIGTIGIKEGKLFSLFLIVGVLSSPIAYFLAYTGNKWSGVPSYMLFADSLDSMIVGAILCALSFLIGTIISKKSI